jgi:hypothetical protein
VCVCMCVSVGVCLQRRVCATTASYGPTHGGRCVCVPCRVRVRLCMCDASATGTGANSDMDTSVSFDPLERAPMLPAPLRHARHHSVIFSFYPLLFMHFFHCLIVTYR